MRQADLRQIASLSRNQVCYSSSQAREIFRGSNSVAAEQNQASDMSD
jgi:hypothetical protein